MLWWGSPLLPLAFPTSLPLLVSTEQPAACLDLRSTVGRAGLASLRGRAGVQEAGMEKHGSLQHAQPWGLCHLRHKCRGLEEKCVPSAGRAPWRHSPML